MLLVDMLCLTHKISDKLSPTGWRQMFTQILQLRDGQIRFCALLSMLGGALVLLLLS